MPVPQPEEVMELASELKEARSRVAELESRWKSFFSQPSQANNGTVFTVSVPYLKPRIIEYLQARPDQSYSMQTVAQALDAKENSVGPYLSDLFKEGKIERRGRGLYGALQTSLPIDDAKEKSPAYQ